MGKSCLLSVIIPVYNEATTVAEVLSRVLSAQYVGQVVVVDDGSTDRTWQAMTGFRSELAESVRDGPRTAEVIVVRHELNQGKGAAIRTALEYVRGQFCIIQDADLEYDPADYSKLIEQLIRGKAKIVYGSRYLDRSAADGRPALSSLIGVRLLNRLARQLYRVRLTDIATCYKAFPTEALREMDLQCNRFEFCVEVTAKASRLGIRIVEVPISYTPRTRAEGKKIRWRDGAKAMQTLWRWRRWESTADAS